VAAATGLWWKSLIAAWLVLFDVGAVSAAVGADIPDWIGFPALLLAWLIVWGVWRHWSRGRHDNILGPAVLGHLRRLLAIYCVALVLLGTVVLILDSKGGLDPTAVPTGAVAVGVTVVGVICLVGGRVGVPGLDGSDRAALLESYRRRLFVRLAWSEAPALVAFGGFLLLGGQAWVFGIGLFASLAGLALAAPTRRSAQRDQEQMEEAGSSADVWDALTA
jgi:hypothetical protein